MEKNNYKRSNLDVRISISNFVRNIQGKLFGILNKNDYENKGKKVITSIGGGAEIYNIDYLLNLGCKDFFVNENGFYDARFFIREENIQQILDILICENILLYEFSVLRELNEELCFEKIENQKDSILKFYDLIGTEEFYKGTILGKGYSNRIPGVITYYIWNYFDIILDNKLSKSTINKLLNSPNSFLLTKEEVLSGYSKEGIPIAKNIKSSLNIDKTNYLYI
ncbi:hypothetical protein [Candidatus Vampirococcus lugosii]|uniref:Uncharacterized protein n=1 Tax=Candidatus Vampirococcus lugosii TaxID=2789015 RepID=A0ABS5QJQ6_9BACT|nr:hypothetical protein [Candidatus Vampirococcus lugosii]MBS8121501.1 hypothetical protein [Candidatus Vampirococcus lugosii]